MHLLPNLEPPYRCKPHLSTVLYCYIHIIEVRLIELIYCKAHRLPALFFYYCLLLHLNDSNLLIFQSIKVYFFLFRAHYFY